MSTTSSNLRPAFPENRKYPNRRIHRMAKSQRNRSHNPTTCKLYQQRPVGLVTATAITRSEFKEMGNEDLIQATDSAETAISRHLDESDAGRRTRSVQETHIGMDLQNKKKRSRIWEEHDCGCEARPGK